MNSYWESYTDPAECSQHINIVLYDVDLIKMPRSTLSVLGFLFNMIEYVFRSMHDNSDMVGKQTVRASDRTLSAPKED
jgi:hypothetical protein